MSDESTADARTRAALAAWASTVGCRLLVLFGSSVSGDRGTPRDIDLALSFPELPKPARRLAIIGELQDLCGGKTVDVVYLHPDTNPVLRFEIFRGGVPLYESRSDVFIEETVRAIALYQDALPFRRALREQLTKTESPT